MEEIKRLFKNKYNIQGKIDITVFFVNIYLLFIHILLLIIYLLFGHKLMTIYSLITTPIYLYYIFNCYKTINRYMGIAFCEIWVHLILGILSFGWTPCYQNWCFGMIVAYFLPAFDLNKTNNRPFIYAFMVIFTYFFLSTFYPLINLKITMDLTISQHSILFIINNLSVFVAIILFAIFYTSRSTRKELELSRKADYDELTGLYNRHAISQLGNKLIESAKENKKPYYIAMIDIDFFKKINDTYGHTSGDMVLRKLSNIIRIYSIKGIIPGRWGGEEFIMIAPHQMKYSEFTKILESLRSIVEKTEFLTEKNEKIKLTISIGSVIIKKHKNIDESISLADNNLYKAKTKGRNRLVK